MQEIEQALVTFFERVAQKDSAQLATLGQESHFAIEQGRWTFTLPDLYLFLQRQDDVFSIVTYSQFRSAIFNCTINQAVKLHGAEIAIACNREKVDKSEYALIWQAAE